MPAPVATKVSPQQATLLKKHDNVTYYHIPDFMSYCPYQPRVNAGNGSVTIRSLDWLAEMSVLPAGGRKRIAMEKANVGLFTSMCYPDVDVDRFRVLCDYMYLLFIFDDILDQGALLQDENATKTVSDIVMNALCDPDNFDVDFPCGRAFADVWSRALDMGCSRGTHRRFLETTDAWLQAVQEQVADRAQKRLPDVESHIALRRLTGNVQMCMRIGEWGLGVDVPDEVFECPEMVQLEDCVNDIIVIANDIYSYNLEQSQGDFCNIIEVAMEQYGFDLQASIDFAGSLVRNRIDTYATLKQNMPSWGPRVDADVQRHLRFCESAIASCIHWPLLSARYFGKDAAQVRKTLRVKLLPRGTAPA